jgi:ATP-dependent DNA ligase
VACTIATMVIGFNWGGCVTGGTAAKLAQQGRTDLAAELTGMARSVAPARAVAAGLPEWVPPQLTQLVDAAPEGDDWLHEIKFDGYRMHARLDRGAVRLLTDDGDAYPPGAAEGDAGDRLSQ